MRNVAKISAANAEILKEMEFEENSKYNPIQDGNGNWIISMHEAGFIDRNEIYIQIIEWVEPETTGEI